MFTLLLYHLRSNGILVGTHEWLTFLKGVQRGLVNNIDELYQLGRTTLCKTESEFDAYDQGFLGAFEGVEFAETLFEEMIHEQLRKWLETGKMSDGELVEPDIPIDKLMEELEKRLKEQTERHDGGSHWVGTGGSSPFGHSGRASHGVRVGGQSKNRSAISVATDRKWREYRTDKQLDSRDLQVVLKQLRQLTPTGEWQLNIHSTIRRTVANGGEIELDFQRERKNRLHVVLLLDSGGSMEPYARMVEEFFTAFSENKGFKSFQSWHFHNVPYGRFFSENQSVSIEDLLTQWTPHHRIVWVGDACMAPYELFSPTYYSNMRGIDWIQRITENCPKSIWLNPENPKYWNHPTIEGIASVVSMKSLSLDGLAEGIQQLR